MIDGKELIFVYNADSGLVSAYLDAMHKIFSPKTYPCNLCAITYGNFKMKNEWRNFIEKLPLKTSFLHRDEWIGKTKRHDQLPAVFLSESSGFSVLIPSEEMEKLSLTQLKIRLEEELEALNID